MADTPQRSPRLAAYRGEYRKNLREKIDADGALADIEKVNKKIKAKWKSLEPAQVGALKLLSDNSWRKLGKLLPDLKAVEHDPGEHAENLARDQMNVRLAEIYAAAHSRIDGRGSGGALPLDVGSKSTH
jgi:hypothetical protein